MSVALAATARGTGKKAVNAIRNEGRIPGVFYVDGGEAKAISVEKRDLRQFIFTAATHVIDLQVDGGESTPCILKDFTLDPITDEMVHFDLYGLTEGRPVEVKVPVALKGTAAGERQGGKLRPVKHKLRVKCLPKHIPDNIEIEITNLGIGQSVKVADIKDENLTMVDPASAVIVTVQAKRGAKKVAEEEA